MKNESSHESDERPEISKASEAMTPVTERAIVSAAGTITGLKMMKSGVMTGREITVPMKVMPARPRSVPPTGRRATTVRTWEVVGPLAIVDINDRTCRKTMRTMK